MKSGDTRRPIALVALNHGDDTKKTNIPEPSFMSTDTGVLRDAEEWLSGVLSQMLVDRRNEHLPFTVIADITKADKKNTESFEERMQKLTARSLIDRLAGYVSYTEAFNLADAKPPEMDDDELRRVAKSRYALMLGRRLHE
jgi:hypothetical protein